MEFINYYRDPQISASLKQEIECLSSQLASKISIMEVCGTHTMAIAKAGIRSILPPSIDLVSGPGCPVCVTDCGYIDTAIELANRGITVATFGDMLKVPGSDSSLAAARAQGADVQLVYSPLDALRLAQADKKKEVVFLAIGFETTVAPVISLVAYAQQAGIDNLSLLVAFKTVPQALDILATMPDKKLDAFLCPAHVSAIIGARAYEPIVAKHKLPCVIAGFEAVDILLGIKTILEQLKQDNPSVQNMYGRVVRYQGNQKAQEMIAKYTEPADVSWRGLGKLPLSGLRLRDIYSKFDAEKRFSITIPEGKIKAGCRCSEVLRGVVKPNECKLFGTICTPDEPLGPCMVSTEGSCSAYYKYNVGIL